MGMGLNFGLPQGAPNIVQPTNSNYYNLQPSQYKGFMQVGNKNVFQKDGQFYEPYTVSPAKTQYGRNPYGVFQPISKGPYDLPYKPMRDQFGKLPGGIVAKTSGGPTKGTIYSGSQAFRPYTGGIASLYNAPAATRTVVPSFLSTPIAPQTTGANYGANQFLNTGNLLGFNFTPAQTSTTTSNP